LSPSRLIAVSTFALALAACNGDTAEEGQAAGQVLEGTISDQMLPVDQVRSEAPLADPTAARAVAARAGEGAEAGETPEAGEAEPAEEAPAEPAEPAEAGTE
jgi:hypothetical protein